ncbi:MAG: hypothetical protein KBT82_12705 [Marinobacter sp.]|uniref:hypothetical protein n=1 Tax=Marinobacter sp. TaxID=50741 RepID=UPI001B4C6E50|nr:hypothetical protein [Marinobacter sp.]MBQ0747715.1 hypothetical protein [Marinobacter sp.]MBQ0815013.1 hypothetical protein [Marinobacter sp.]
MNHRNPPAHPISGAALVTSHTTRIAAAIAATLTTAAAMPAIAGVQAMTSDEMVETYVKDSRRD